MSKELIETLKAKDSNDKAIIYFINNNYYSVVYKGKEEYYTKNIDTAKLVAKIILVFYDTLSKGMNLFSNAKTDENRWSEIVGFLNNVSQKSVIDKELAISIYKTIEEAYYLQTDNEVDKAHLGKINVIKTKDNLMYTIGKITAVSDKIEAGKNYNRYRKIRNSYVEKNPGLSLKLI